MKTIRRIIDVMLIAGFLSIAVLTVGEVRKFWSLQTHDNLVVMKYYDYDHHKDPVEMIGTGDGLFECPLDAVEVGHRYLLTTRGTKRVDRKHHEHPRVIKVEEI